jgi:imidazolonepropionase-like amidohydrolase
LFGVRSFDINTVALEYVAVRSARCTRDLRAALDAGITSVREVGGLGVYLARAVAEGAIEGPAIYVAGSALGITGGHADLHSFPLPWVEEHARLVGDGRLADGVAECMRATREQLRRNAKVIKVCASGGVLSEVDDPIHQQFTPAPVRVRMRTSGLSSILVTASRSCSRPTRARAAAAADPGPADPGPACPRLSRLRQTGHARPGPSRARRRAGRP